MKAVAAVAPARGSALRATPGCALPGQRAVDACLLRQRCDIDQLTLAASISTPAPRRRNRIAGDSEQIRSITVGGMQAPARLGRSTSARHATVEQT